MGRVDVQIPDELDKKLRTKMLEKFGGKKGSLTEAVEAAITLWVSKSQ
jgi:hypothetical protein